MNVKNLITLFTAAFLAIISGCGKRDASSLGPASNPDLSEVFLDKFARGLDYSAFGNSKTDAFEIDENDTYSGSQSIKITIPGKGDSSGSYAGGVLYSTFPRDLSGYNALTFWGKASRNVLAEIGLGNDNQGNVRYAASQKKVAFGSAWKKYIIPFPQPEKLTEERGLFWFAADAGEQETGAVLWFDEVKFEQLNTIGHPRVKLKDSLLSGSINGKLNLGDIVVLFNVDGADQTINAAETYFSFSSLNPAVATIDSSGDIIGVASGETQIIVSLNSGAADTIKVKIGSSVAPSLAAPVPQAPAQNVLSLFSNAYTDHENVVWNTYWQWSTALIEDLQIAGNDIKLYTNLNFVGIEFKNPTINATGMTHFHIDLWIMAPSEGAPEFKMKLVDFGANGVYDGGDDSSHELTFTAGTTSVLAPGKWISIDIPLTDFVDLKSHANLAQLVLSGNISTVYIDNVYFRK